MSRKSSCCRANRMCEPHAPYCNISKTESAAKLRATRDEKNRVAKSQALSREK